MKRKFLRSFIFLSLLTVSLYANESIVRIGGEFGWGFDFAGVSFKDENEAYSYMAENTGFCLGLTDEYDFTRSWGVKADISALFGRNADITYKCPEGDLSEDSTVRSGLSLNIALDARYSYYLTPKFSISVLAGAEMLSGYLLKGCSTLWETYDEEDEEEVYSDSYYRNLALGINIGIENSFHFTERISVIVGADGAWFFYNTAGIVDYFRARYPEYRIGTYNFFVHPYLGVTYSFR